MHQASYLLSMLLTMLAGRGLAAEALDPWRAWVIFKHYVRTVDEVPDPGVSVQLSRESAGTLTLDFIRQVVEPDENWLEPVGGVVVSFTFADPEQDGKWHELWSFEHRSFERFVDAVEQTPEIADLLVRRPISSRVEWEEA